MAKLGEFTWGCKRQLEVSGVCVLDISQLTHVPSSSCCSCLACKTQTFYPKPYTMYLNMMSCVFQLSLMDMTICMVLINPKAQTLDFKSWDAAVACHVAWCASFPAARTRLVVTSTTPAASHCADSLCYTCIRCCSHVMTTSAHITMVGGCWAALLMSCSATHLTLCGSPLASPLHASGVHQHQSMPHMVHDSKQDVLPTCEWQAQAAS